jgi:hypothetical protein
MNSRQMTARMKDAEGQPLLREFYRNYNKLLRRRASTMRFWIAGTALGALGAYGLRAFSISP